jgi:hypothetical protein
MSDLKNIKKPNIAIIKLVESIGILLERSQENSAIALVDDAGINFESDDDNFMRESESHESVDIDDDIQEVDQRQHDPYHTTTAFPEKLITNQNAIDPADTKEQQSSKNIFEA